MADPSFPYQAYLTWYASDIPTGAILTAVISTGCFDYVW